MTSAHAPRIPEITAHLATAGGKRLRPMLTLAAARMYPYGGAHHCRLAAAVEFIHIATLLHDDVVDQSQQRRGRPTANLLWDNKSSVLVGDYLFSRAFQLMVETNNLPVLDILAQASATIAEGEVLQLASLRNTRTDAATYLQVVRGKTAALFAAAAQAGGMSAGASAPQVQALFDYGDALGISFQMTDDLLDYRGDSTQTGKRTGNDFREGKVTLPLIKAMACADPQEHGFWQRTIAQGQQEAGDFDHALALLHRHGALEATEAEAVRWSAQARASLAALPSGVLREALAALTDYVITRAH